MAKLKVYGGCYDGKNRVVVAAATKKAAYAAMAPYISSTYHGWCQYTSVTGSPREVEAAMSAPGTAFSGLNDYHSDFVALTKDEVKP